MVPAAVKSWKWKYSIKGKRSKDRLLSSTFHPTLFFSRWHTNSRKYDTFHRKQAVLSINLLGKGLTQEINGNGAPFDGLLQSLNLVKPAGYFNYYWNPWVTLYNMVISLSNTMCWSQRCLSHKNFTLKFSTVNPLFSPPLKWAPSP